MSPSTGTGSRTCWPRISFHQALVQLPLAARQRQQRQEQALAEHLRGCPAIAPSRQHPPHAWGGS
jgi:hypothetical protein